MADGQYDVTVLRNGLSTQVEHGYVKLQCSIVLIKGPCGIMVVNPGSAWDGPFLVEALQKHGVKDPAEVKYVVCTDGRAIHVGLLSVFTKAEMIIVGHDIQKPGDIFIEHDFTDDFVPFELDENLSVVGTPGTMEQQVTVMVKGILSPNDSFSEDPPKSSISIAITGSIFGDAEDAMKTGIFHKNALPPDFGGDVSASLAVWRSSRNRILGVSDWIIPAFGKPFKVQPEFSKTPCVELA